VNTVCHSERSERIVSSEAGARTVLVGTLLYDPTEVRIAVEPLSETKYVIPQPGT